MIAMIAVSAATFAIDKPYSYRIPQGMVLRPGMRVMVPYGRGNRRTEGIVLGIDRGTEDGLKVVEQCLDDAPVLDDRMLHLAAFMRERYFCTFYEAARAMLPAGLWFHAKDTFRLADGCEWETASIRQKDARTLLTLLRDLGGCADADVLRQAVTDDADFQKAAAYLLRKKWVTTQTDYRRRTADKTEKLVSLASSAEEAMAFANTRPRSAAMQREVLMTLCAVGSASVKDLCYHTGASLETVRRLEKLGYVSFSERPVLRCREIRPAKLDGPLVLNAEQTAAWEGLSRQMALTDPGVALLYGVTGSGKTSVYLKLIQTCLDSGKSAMFLVPEIALTPQLLGLLAAYFGEQVAVLHSSLAAGERYDQWKRVRNGDARVVVGTRSAVFAPCKDLGLLILDEEQEHSYRSENSPRYAASEVAMWRGAKERALVLLGSATPSVETMFHAKNGDYCLYRLRQRYNGRPLPKVRIVDMREEIKAGNDLSLSQPLMESMRRNFEDGKQAILFLNRRGNSRALVCVDCRKTPECPRCNTRLTYHSANERLMCHYCGYSQRAAVKCPDCGGSMKRVGTGTQKVQQELLELCPDMTVSRMDTDTVNAVNTHEKILQQFQQEHQSVLIGTQMVAKGLNLPDVTLVGVLDADLSLYTDSYRAAETTFNMLTQVVGRSGRGDASGEAMIQTMAPGHQVIHLASNQDYDGFYALEIGMRRLQNAPPFGDYVHITFSGQDEGAVMRGAVKFRDSLVDCVRAPQYSQKPCSVLGPAACPVPKINYHYRFRLTLRCRMDRDMRLLLAHLLRQFAGDKANRGVSAFVEVNGYD